MKIRQPIVFVCALGILALLATGVFTRSPGEDDPRARRSRPIVRFFREQGQMEWPFSAEIRSSGHSATTLFKVLASSAPDMFETGKDVISGINANWTSVQVKAMTADAVLDTVVKELNLAEAWGITSTAAAAKLRGITEVSRQNETDVVAITVRYSEPLKAAEMANAVRDAYAAWRESVETERVRRLVANTEAKIKTQQAEVEAAAAKGGSTPENDGYARGMVTYESQLLLLNTMKEHHMRLSVNEGVPRKVVEILEIATPRPAN